MQLCLTCGLSGKAALPFLCHKLCVILTPSPETEGTQFRYLYFNLHHHTVRATPVPVVPNIGFRSRKSSLPGTLLRVSPIPAACSGNPNTYGSLDRVKLKSKHLYQAMQCLYSHTSLWSSAFCPSVSQMLLGSRC